jgi:hypothetical protein
MQSISPSRRYLSLALLLVFLSARNLPVTAKHLVDEPHPSNPFLNPKDDPNDSLGYIASNTLTAIAFSTCQLSICVYRRVESETGSTLTVALVQTFSLLKWGGWWMACMTIGAYSYDPSSHHFDDQ